MTSGSRHPNDAQEETTICSNRCDGGANAKCTNSINTGQGKAGTPQEEGGRRIKIASEIDIVVLLQVIITALRLD
jgi:hypothetical protein